MFAYHPLGTREKFRRPDFPFPICFIYGEKDWMRLWEDECGKYVITYN